MPELAIIIEQVLAKVPGGTGRYAAQITEALVETAPAGWTVQPWVARHRNIGLAEIPGCPPPRRLAAGPRTLAEMWRKGLPPKPTGDLIHATTPLAPAKGTRPLVVTIHDAAPISNPKGLSARQVEWYAAMIKRSADKADAIIVPTSAVREELNSLYKIGDRIHVIGHGVTPMAVPNDADSRRRRWSLPDRYVISLATLEPRKGLDVLVKALARPEVGKVHLVVVGQTGWGGLDLGSVAEKAGLDPWRIHQLGRLTDTELASAMAGASVLAMPSRVEGFGLPVLEAMAAGLPVVTSDAPALLEVGGEAIVSAPVGDDKALSEALAEVLSDESKAAAMAAAGLKRAASYRWSDAAEQTWQVHTSLLS